ncbi:molybdopterin-dependent oxidoreductase [Pseudomonas sp. Je.1.5.c]|uniref:molybdopterin-dependent oxidoreductase n=1 Tax=Pseudomonas sp. Je.1.5.c TaxID=3142839 RepID=UPI003DA9684D
MSDYRRIQTASHWGVYNVGLMDGHIVDVSPFAHDPAPIPMMGSLPQMVRSPLRIDKPYVRASYLTRRQHSRHLRGCDAFVPVSWEEALDLVEEGLRRVKAQYGNESIYGGSYGWASAGRLHHSPSVLKRFLGQFGGYVDKTGNHSFGAAMHIAPYVVGSSDVTSMVVPWREIAEHTELVVMFGGSHSKNMQIDTGGAVMHETDGLLSAIAKRQVRFLNISPSRDDTPHQINGQWWPIVPNTDTALMLGLAHVLVQEGLHAQHFIDKFCEGFAPFRDYLLGITDGVPKNPSWASEICGVLPEAIISLAREMASKRTVITTAWSVQRADHGEQPVWMTIVLACLLGQINTKGGGFSLGPGGVSGIGVERPEKVPRPTMSLGCNPVDIAIPVGRVTDMLLNPGMELNYNGSTLRMPDIKLIYSAGGNPFHHNANLNRFLDGWRRPDLVVVHEPWWSPPAKFADIVLPATTSMERNDILATEFQRHWIAMHQVIPPVAQSRNDFDIFAELADRLGFGEAYTEGRDESGWLEHMYNGAREKALNVGYAPPPFEEFWVSGLYEFPVSTANREKPLLSDYWNEPEKYPLNTRSGKIEIFSEAIAEYNYLDCPPHPSWLEPAEWIKSPIAKKYPIHLLTNQPAGKLHSQLDPSDLSVSFKRKGKEVLKISPMDAGVRNINSGDIIIVFNDRGAFLACANVTENILGGVASIPTGAWFDPADPAMPDSIDKHGNPNVVTLDNGTSQLAQGSIAQTALVQIEKFSGDLPVTAFCIPYIIPRSDI